MRSAEARRPEIEVMLTMRAAFLHQRYRCLGQQEGACEIHVQRALEFGQRRVERRLEHRVAGIVHQRVEPSETLLHLRGRGLDLIGQGHIAGQRQGAIRRVERRYRERQRRAIDVEQRDAPAVGEEAFRGGEPDAARRAGDESVFPASG